MSQIYLPSSGSPTPPPFPPFNPAQNLFYVDDFFAGSNSDQGQFYLNKKLMVQ